MDQKKITVSQWHELTDKQKETLRIWATKHDFGLDIIPSHTSEACDYAALLTLEQIQKFLADNGVTEFGGTLETLWMKVKEIED